MPEPTTELSRTQLATRAQEIYNLFGGGPSSLVWTSPDYARAVALVQQAKTQGYLQQLEDAWPQVCTDLRYTGQGSSSLKEFIGAWLGRGSFNLARDFTAIYHGDQAASDALTFCSMSGTFPHRSAGFIHAVADYRDDKAHDLVRLRRAQVAYDDIMRYARRGGDLSTVIANTCGGHVPVCQQLLRDASAEPMPAATPAPGTTPAPAPMEERGLPIPQSKLDPDASDLVLPKPVRV